MTLLRSLIVLPTWALVNAITASPVLPPKHPWKGRWFPLFTWAENSTPANLMLSIALWIGATCWIVLLRRLLCN